MRSSLATRISFTLVGVLLLAVVSSIVAIMSAHRFRSYQETIVADNLASVRAAEELEIALLEQRGYVSSYVLDDGNTRWLDDLAERLENFDFWLRQAHATARSDDERDILATLAVVHHEYEQHREEVVARYKAGDLQGAKHLLLNDVASSYGKAYDECEKLIEVNRKLVEDTTETVRRRVEQITVLVMVSLGVTLFLGAALLWMFFYGVIFPLRRLAADAKSAAGDARPESGEVRNDELRQLGHYLQLLMNDVAETRSDLEQSRTRLAQADRLAIVGKLAASVAHEIRNPLTSVKMWLYSLQRSLDNQTESKEKLAVVSEEINRLENIVRHFLEFARPPDLKPVRLDVRQVLDRTIELTKYRAIERQVCFVRQDDPLLPQVIGDADQLRQVFVNLINNGIDATPAGGEIHISSAVAQRNGRGMVVVYIEDTGPGMPAEVRERVFEPFFTTKQDGTGLGLCIAASVMTRHGGALVLEPCETHGTRWAVWIPAAGE